MDKISLGYQTFAANRDFDLNTLRELCPIKRVGKVYTQDPTTTIFIELGGVNFTEDKEELLSAELAEANASKDNYYKWYNDSNKEVTQLKCKLEQLTAELEALKGDK